MLYFQVEYSQQNGVSWRAELEKCEDLALKMNRDLPLISGKNFAVIKGVHCTFRWGASATSKMVCHDRGRIEEVPRLRSQDEWDTQQRQSSAKYCSWLLQDT